MKQVENAYSLDQKRLRQQEIMLAGMKRLYEQTKSLLERYHAALEQSGENVRAGIMGRFTSKEDSKLSIAQRAAKAEEKSMAQAMMMFGAGSIMAPIGNFLKSALNTITSSTTPANPAPKPSLSAEFTIISEKVNPHIYDEFKKQVTVESEAAEHFAAEVADNKFVGPLQPEFLNLTDAFHKGTIKRDDFVAKMTQEVMRQKGFIFCEPINDYALTKQKMDSLCRCFAETQAAGPYIARVAMDKPETVIIHIAEFNNAAQKPPVFPAPAIQPVLSFA